MTQTEIEVLLSDAEQSLHQQFSALDKIEQVNFARVMDAFRAEQVAVRHFAPTMVATHWNESTREFSAARMHWCAPQSLPERMPWRFACTACSAPVIF